MNLGRAEGSNLKVELLNNQRVNTLGCRVRRASQGPEAGPTGLINVLQSQGDSEAPDPSIRSCDPDHPAYLQLRSLLFRAVASMRKSSGEGAGSVDTRNPGHCSTARVIPCLRVKPGRTEESRRAGWLIGSLLAWPDGRDDGQ